MFFTYERFVKVAFTERLQQLADQYSRYLYTWPCAFVWSQFLYSWWFNYPISRENQTMQIYFVVHYMSILSREVQWLGTIYLDIWFIPWFSEVSVHPFGGDSYLVKAFSTAQSVRPRFFHQNCHQDLLNFLEVPCIFHMKVRVKWVIH